MFNYGDTGSNGDYLPQVALTQAVYQQGCQPLETHFSNKLQWFQYFRIIVHKFQYFLRGNNSEMKTNFSILAKISVTKV